MTWRRSRPSADGTWSRSSTSAPFGARRATSSAARGSPPFALDAPGDLPSALAEPAWPLTPGPIALGVYPAGFPVDRESVARYVARAGRPPAIVHYFRRWTGEPIFDPAPARLVHDGGAVPMISWEPWQGLRPILDGAWDAMVADYARAVADYGRPLLMRFAHEMNLPQIPWFGPAPTFRAAWQRVHAAFDAAGATNVRWVWSPYVNGRGVAELSEYFPGAGLVDWPALDGYNWGRSRPWQRWPSFERLFGASLATITELMPGAPVMLAEIGCAAHGGDKAAWMRETLLHAIPDRHPEVRAVVWFDHHRPEHADWRIDSSPESLAAWREAVADPRYELGAGELLGLHHS